MMRLMGAMVLAALALLSADARAHDLQHTIRRGDAVVITVTFPDGMPFSFESFELFAESDSIPFQVGRSDAQGRIVFLPDSARTCRVRAFAHDGHGIDITFATEGWEALPDAQRAPLSRLTRILVGVALVFGLFGVLVLIFKGRT